MPQQIHGNTEGSRNTVLSELTRLYDLEIPEEDFAPAELIDVLAEYSAGAGGYLTLVAYGRAALPAPVDAANAEALLVPAIEGIASANGIKPGKVAVSVSSQTVFSRLAEIPARPGSDRFDQLVRYEIEQNVPFPVDEIVCDSQVLGETESGDSSVIVVAARIEQM